MWMAFSRSRDNYRFFIFCQRACKLVYHLTVSLILSWLVPT